MDSTLRRVHCHSIRKAYGGLATDGDGLVRKEELYH